MKKFKSKKFAAALLAATASLGTKAAPPTAATGSGINKAISNKKIGVPTWSKWLFGFGITTILGVTIEEIIRRNSQTKNNNPEFPDKSNENVEKLNEQQKIDNKIKIKIKDKNDDVQELNASPIKEKKEPKKIGQINAEEEKKKKQSHWVDAYLCQNIIDPDTNIQEIKKIMADNEKEFYEAVEAYHPLKEIMERFKNNQFCKQNFVGFRDLSSMGKLNKTFKAFTYNDVLGEFKKQISINGKPISIKLVENEERKIVNSFRELILKEFGDSQALQYNVEFPGSTIFSIFLFGNNRVAFHRISSSILFECEDPISI